MKGLKDNHVLLFVELLGIFLKEFKISHCQQNWGVLDKNFSITFRPLFMKEFVMVLHSFKVDFLQYSCDFVEYYFFFNSNCFNFSPDPFRLYNTIQNIISWAMFIQFFVSVVNNCVAIVALLFFVSDIFERIYYVIYILGMAIQLFPTCYYGSDFVLLFEKLHYAVFSCNWIGQSKSFKRHMMIFTERSMRETIALAGGIFPIHLDTFFGTCKATYSLFAVVMTMK